MSEVKRVLHRSNAARNLFPPQDNDKAEKPVADNALGMTFAPRDRHENNGISIADNNDRLATFGKNEWNEEEKKSNERSNNTLGMTFAPTQEMDESTADTKEINKFPPQKKDSHNVSPRSAMKKNPQYYMTFGERKQRERKVSFSNIVSDIDDPNKEIALNRHDGKKPAIPSIDDFFNNPNDERIDYNDELSLQPNTGTQKVSRTEAIRNFQKQINQYREVFRANYKAIHDATRKRIEAPYQQAYRNKDNDNQYKKIETKYNQGLAIASGKNPDRSSHAMNDKKNARVVNKQIIEENKMPYQQAYRNKDNDNQYKKIETKYNQGLAIASGKNPDRSSHAMNDKKNARVVNKQIIEENKMPYQQAYRNKDNDNQYKKIETKYNQGLAIASGKNPDRSSHAMNDKKNANAPYNVKNGKICGCVAKESTFTAHRGGKLR